jgi:hypothetical protein
MATINPDKIYIENVFDANNGIYKFTIKREYVDEHEVNQGYMTYFETFVTGIPVISGLNKWDFESYKPDEQSFHKLRISFKRGSLSGINPLVSPPQINLQNTQNQPIPNPNPLAATSVHTQWSFDNTLGIIELSNGGCCFINNNDDEITFIIDPKYLIWKEYDNEISFESNSSVEYVSNFLYQRMVVPFQNFSNTLNAEILKQIYAKIDAEYVRLKSLENIKFKPKLLFNSIDIPNLQIDYNKQFGYIRRFRNICTLIVEIEATIQITKNDPNYEIQPTNIQIGNLPYKTGDNGISYFEKAFIGFTNNQNIYVGIANNSDIIQLGLNTNSLGFTPIKWGNEIPLSAIKINFQLDYICHKEPEVTLIPEN